VIRNNNYLLKYLKNSFFQGKGRTNIKMNPPTPPLGVFWDIENCNVPSGKSAMAVCDLIRRQRCFQGHREVEFAVVCDATKESKGVLEELDKAQVDIIHVVSNRKNAADDKLKQIMRRFADIHRDGSRIVLISGDVDFAADIADFKRRMCLSVILLHNANASESLLLAASEFHNFYEILSALPVKHETPVSAVHDEITVSNLPSISDCSEDTITQTLNQIAKQFGGKVTHMYGSHGSANLKFSAPDQARLFKIKYLHFKIQGRPINIHFCYKSRPRGKSISQSPGPHFRNRKRTMSDSSKKGRASSEDCSTRRFSSQDSDFNVDVKVEDQRPRNVDVSESFCKLSLSTNRHVSHRYGKQRYVSDSSVGLTSEDENKERRTTKKTHSKLRSKLKVKNRKKSEATPQFLNRRESPVDDEKVDSGDPLIVMDKLVEISRNLTLLVDSQHVRLDLIADLYNDKFTEDLRSIIIDNDITRFINEFCTDLTIVDLNNVPHIALRKGDFVQNYLSMVNDVLFSLQKENNFSPVPVPVFANRYTEVHGGAEAYLDLDFAMRECTGIKKTRRAFGREFLELSSLFLLGHEMVEVLTKKGGILPLENIYGNYKSVTGKNLDPTIFGFDSLENLLKELDLFVKIMGKKKSIALRSVHIQNTQRIVQQRYNPVNVEGTENATADEHDEVRVQTIAPSDKMTPDIIGETNGRMREGRDEMKSPAPHPHLAGCLSSGSAGKLRLTSFVGGNSQAGLTDRMETENDKSKVKVSVSTVTTDDIVTIEDSVSDAESDLPRLSNTAGKERKKSRLAANFGQK